MMTPEQRAEVRRLFYAEHWPVGTIAAALGVHGDAVRNAVETDRFGAVTAVRKSMLDPYVGFVRETLERYPKVCATRVYEMLKQRGYPGRSAAQVRRLARKLRPHGTKEAYLMRRVLPGEEAQVDWGSFGHVEVEGGRRPLSCFVMVLSHSRGLYVEFTLNQTLESFLRGHVGAFEYFGGVPRAVLYDNLKSAVLERMGEAIRFQPRLLELCGHYHFMPRPCAPGRGNEKGRVERAIQYLRTSFFAARSFRDVAELNAQFEEWRETVAHQRRAPGDAARSVAEVLADERRFLLPLPEHRFETDLLRVVSSGKTPYVRFDRNSYSIPHDLVRKPLTLVAGAGDVRVLDGSVEVARHVRSYGTGCVLEDPAHVAALVKRKRQAQPLKGRDRLLSAAPRLTQFFEMLAERGEAMGHQTVRLLGLLDRYGAAELRIAVDIALERKAYAAGSVAHILEHRRRGRGLPPPVAVTLPSNPKVRDLRVTPHDMEDYDELTR
jgi:transposase